MKRWPLNKAQFWERYPFFRLLLPLVLGVFFYPANTAQASSFLLLPFITVVLSFTVYILLALRKQNTTRNTIAFGCLQVTIFFTAWLLCYLHDIRNDKHWLGNTLADADAFVVQLQQPPEEKDKSWKLIVTTLAATKNDSLTPTTGNAFIYIPKYNMPAMREGDIITVPNDWQPIKNRGNPFEFDYAAYCARQGIYYQQFVGGDEIAFNTYAEEKDLNFIRRAHHWCLTQLEWYIEDRKTLGLLKAMLVGDRATIDDVLANAYAATGIVHIMAISGAHISVFFLLTGFALVWLRHNKYKWIKYIAAIPFIWLYVLIAGAPASAVRAATMFSLLGVGLALQKQPNGINQLLATAFILLCINPSWLFAIGFQLSFVAVLSIFIYYKPIYQLYTPTNKIVKSLWAVVSVSIAAEILIAPLVVYYFHLFPLQFIVANVAAYLFMGLVLILGMLLILLSAFYPVAIFFGDITTWWVTGFNKIVYTLQEFNLSSFQALTLNNWQLFLLYLFITLISIQILLKRSKLIWATATCFCMFLASCCVVHWQSLKQEIFVVYNAGKEPYIELIQGRQATVLYSPKEIDDKTNRYVLQPAHINWHINNVVKQDTAVNLIKCQGSTIFILNQSIKDTTFTADYVVVNYKVKPHELKTIQHGFNPQKIIIGNTGSIANTEQLIKIAAEQNIAIHSLYNAGAFVIGNH